MNKVLEMDMKDNGSFGKCLVSFSIPVFICYEGMILLCICFEHYVQLKKRAPDGINSRGASGASAILGGVPEIANFVSANIAAGYNAQVSSCSYMYPHHHFLVTL